MAAKKAKSKRDSGKKPPVKKQQSESPKKRFLPLRRLLKWVVITVCFIALVPMGLTVVYRVEAIHPVSTLMLGDYVSGRNVERQWLPIDAMSTNLQHSVIMSEDGKFCEHDGIDWDALNAVVENALEGEKTRGASTLTMQTVKNLFLWTGRSYFRKAAEVPLALWFDLIVPKSRVLEIYLNIAEWDIGVYGAQAAAKKYFGKTAERLTRRQAALLTVTLPNPRNRNAAKPSRRMKRVAGIIEKRAKIAGAYVGCLN